MLFTLGFSPKILAKFFLKIAALVSALMLIIALVMIPIVFELQDNFVNFKKTQVKFNYKTGEFGQRFLEWMIFIEKQESDRYENIIMYHPKRNIEDKEQLIIAKEATAQRNEDSFAFKLSNGKMYNFENGQTLFIGNFDKLIVNTQFNDQNYKLKFL